MFAMKTSRHRAKNICGKSILGNSIEKASEKLRKILSFEVRCPGEVDPQWMRCAAASPGIARLRGTRRIDVRPCFFYFSLVHHDVFETC